MPNRPQGFGSDGFSPRSPFLPLDAHFAEPLDLIAGKPTAEEGLIRMSARMRAHAFISLRLSPPLDWRSRSSFSVAGSRPRATSARHRSQTRRGIRVAKRRARGMMTAIQDGCPAQETTPINPRIRTQSRRTLRSRKTALPRRSNLAHERAPPSLAQPGGATLAATPLCLPPQRESASVHFPDAVERR